MASDSLASTIDAFGPEIDLFGSEIDLFGPAIDTFGVPTDTATAPSASVTIFGEARRYSYGFDGFDQRFARYDWHVALRAERAATGSEWIAWHTE